MSLDYYLRAMHRYPSVRVVKVPMFAICAVAIAVVFTFLGFYKDVTVSWDYFPIQREIPYGCEYRSKEELPEGKIKIKYACRGYSDYYVMSSPRY